MAVIFEDHATHGPSDPVGLVTMSVECAPGQMDAIADYLAGVGKCAGVYVVACDAGLKETDHGEQLLQEADSDDQAADLGQGSPAAEGPAAEIGSADAGGTVAGPAGESPAEPEQRDSVGEDLRASEGAGWRD